MRIAFVTGSASRLAGGLYNSVRRLSQALTDAGHNVDVFALEDEYGPEDAPTWLPVVPRRLRSVGPRSLGYAHGLAQHLIAGDFDLVHQHGIWQATSLSVAGWRHRTGKPVMISPRGMLDPWALENSNWKKRLAGALYERANILKATALHALSEAEAKAIRAYHPDGRVDLIPNGTDLPDDMSTTPRPAFMPDDDRKTLLFVGRIHPKKGIDELLEAFLHLKKSRSDLAAQWRIVIAGWDDGGHQAAVDSFVTANGLTRDVILPGALYGAVKDAALRNADAFVLTSRSEGLPMSVLEAWAYGLPVVMTDACNLPEGFAAGAAYRIKDSREEFRTDLAAALSARDLAARGAAGRVLVANRFNWSQIARSHEQIYRELCH